MAQIYANDAELVEDGKYFAKQFEQLLPTLLEERDAPRSAERIFPLVGGFSYEMETYTRRAIINKRGEAHEGNIDDSPADVPLVDFDLKEEKQGFWEAKIGWKLSYRERRMARRANLPLDTTKARLAVERLYDKEEAMLWNGSAFYNKQGVLQIAAQPGPGGFTGNWEAASPVQMYNDLALLSKKFRVDSQDRYKESVTVVLPMSFYDVFEEKARSDDNDTTVKEYVMRNLSGRIENITYARELDASKKILVFARNPNVVSFGRVPMYPVGPVEEYLNQRVITHYELRSTGLEIHDTNAFAVIDGATAVAAP